MRCLLVVNPAATTASPRVRDVLTSALASEYKLEVAETTHRGHARELAGQAREDGLDVVAVFGGDGTLNEAVNGLLAAGPAAEVPALAVVPGGLSNVFARGIGLPADPVEATAVLLAAMRTGSSRRIGVGLAGDRYFTFCAGIGLDAAAVARVEQRRARGRRPTTYGYVRCAVTEFFTGIDRRHPELTLRRGDEDLALHVALVCNTDPWTYLDDRAVRPCPQASFDTGLDVFGLSRARTLPTLRHLAQMMRAKGRGPHGRSVRLLHDLDTFELRATRPLPVQVDGDFIGHHESVTMRSVPRALRVLL